MSLYCADISRGQDGALNSGVALGVSETYGKLPLSFEPNQGQTDGQVRFLSRGRGYTLFLTGDEAVLALGSASQKSRVESRKEERVAQHSPFNAAAFPGFFEPPEIRNSKSATRHSSLVTRHSAATLRLRLVGANPNAKVSGLDELPGKSNYFLGNDPKKWRTNVANYAKVKYANVYPGIDLVYYGNQRQLEYDFVVAPGADPRAIRFAVETGDLKFETRNSKIENGQASCPSPESRVPSPGGVRIDSNGDLVIQTDAGEVRFHRPLVHQPDPESRAPNPGSSTDNGRLTTDDPANSPFTIHNSQFVDGRYVLLAGNRIGFEVPYYDKRRPLIIDPVLNYSTYLGGLDVDAAFRIAVDSAGNAYVTGMTSSDNFPTTSGARPFTPGGTCTLYIPHMWRSIPCPDAFVTKLNAAGSALVYSTYLGGSRGDIGVGISVDSSGNAYVVGSTSSSDFPTTPGVFQSTHHEGGEIFIAKLNTSGAINFSTYVGGSRDDIATSSATDSAGSTYITGTTFSDDFPVTQGTFQTAHGAGTCSFSYESAPCPDAFVAKLNATGTALDYATFLGGNNFETGLGIAVDAAGNALVTGTTLSDDFPVLNAMQSAAHGGSCGPSGTLHPCTDGFVSKLNATGTAPVYSTYVGGNGDEGGTAIATDSSGNAYVAGLTNSTDFPTGPGTEGTALGGGNCGSQSNPWNCPDAFVTKLLSGGALDYSRYLGGSSYDAGFGIAVDAAGNAYVTGGTGSNDFPTVDAFQSNFAGGSCSFQRSGVTYIVSCPNAFLTKLAPTGSAAYSTYHGGAGGDVGFGVAVDTSYKVYLAGTTVSSDFPTVSPFQAHLAGKFEAFVAKASPTFSLAAAPDSSTSATVTAGQTATYKLRISPNGFSGTATLACTGAPTASTCTLSKNSVNLDGVTPVDVNVTVTTTARSILAPKSGGRRPPLQEPQPLGRHSGLPLQIWLLALVMLASLAAIHRTRPGLKLAPPLLASALMVMLLWLACGGGGGGGGGGGANPGTPLGTYTLTITATSGSVSKTITLSLTVN